MATVSIGVLKIRTVKSSMNLENIAGEDIKRENISLDRFFNIKTDDSENIVSIAAGISLEMLNERSVKIELFNLVVETIFRVKNLKDHLDDKDNLKEGLLKILVNTAYDHARAIQATITISTPLEKYLIPLKTITKSDDFFPLDNDHIKELSV